MHAVIHVEKLMQLEKKSADWQGFQGYCSVVSWNVTCFANNNISKDRDGFSEVIHCVMEALFSHNN